MSKTSPHQNERMNQFACAKSISFAGKIERFSLACFVLMSLAVLLPLAQAQTITFGGNTAPLLARNLYVGGGSFTAAYTNLQFRCVTNAGNPNLVTFLASGQPAGTTITFSGPNAPVTNNITVSAINVVPGVYPITIIAQTNGVQFGSDSTAFNLIVGNVWTNLSTQFVSSGTDVKWSTLNWSAGALNSSDDVLFQDAGGNTNFVDTSTTIGSLTYLRNTTGGTNFLTTINDGVTLSVTGPRGLLLNEDGQTAPNVNRGMTVNIKGTAGATLIVSNSSANYAVVGNSTAASGVNSGTILSMTNLDRQIVSVNRVGFGDATLASAGAVLCEQVFVEFAKSNYFTASYSNSFNGVDFTNSIQLFNHIDLATSAFSSGNAMTLQLGQTNVFFADSFRAAGCNAQGANVLRFTPAFTNAISPPVAYFRSTNNTRMSFWGLGVASGTNAGTRFSRITAFFGGGLLDLKADTMWLGANSASNSSAVGSGNAAAGTLTFGGNPSGGQSLVDVNNLVLGNQRFTNNYFATGALTVGTNATVVVNNALELGHTPADATFVETIRTRGILTINGGTANINQITAGQLSTNNQVVLGVGGRLVVTNTIASSANGLVTFSMDGAQLTFFVNAGVTNAYVTNLTTTVNATKINIASVSGFGSFPATNILIAYQTAAAHNFAIGTLPAGFNNMQINDNTGNKTIELIINTNAPKNLAWRGPGTSWDHSSLNWIDLNTLAAAKFTDGDSVVFDDTAAVPTSVDIVENILPGQSGTGILVTNNVNNFIFNNSGGAIGGTTLVKTGTASLQLDASTSVAAQVQKGLLSGSGALGSANVSVGAILNFSGAIGGALVVDGTGTLGTGGTVNGAVTITGVATNAGTIQGGSLTLQSGSSLYNSGSLANIGAAAVATNATLINAATIGSGSIANSLTINGTFKDMGLGAITVDQLTISGTGTFIPGGDGIGTTTVLTTGNGTIPGLVRLLQGSTTTIKVDFNNLQTNTMVLAERFVFGPSHGLPKAQDGATLSIINTGIPPFAAGQQLKLFGYSGGAGNFFDAGLNTTNSFPVVTPATPGAGLAWDPITRMLYEGLLQVVGIASNPTNITPMFTVTSSNVVTEISWPTDHLGWSLQQLTTTTAVGLRATNWTTIFGSSQTNDVVITNSSPTSDAAVFYRLINQ